MATGMDLATLRQILATLQQQSVMLQQQETALQQQIAAVQGEIARASNTAPAMVREQVVAAQPALAVVTAPKKEGRPRKYKQCTVAGCKETHVAQGLCAKHYAAARRAKRKQGARPGATSDVS